MLHQTIIGLEAKKQLAKIGIKKPDVVIACAGGGSNFAGLSFPFINDKIHGETIEIIPVEPSSCPTLTRGVFAYDFGDSAGMTPLLPMHTLGHNFLPSPIHAGGLRYHGMSPLVSQRWSKGLISPRAVSQLECYKAAIQWARSEGFLVAPETSHAVAVTIQEALKAKEEGKEKVILMNLSGHGHMDSARLPEIPRGPTPGTCNFLRKRSTKRKRNSASSPSRRWQRPGSGKKKGGTFKVPPALSNKMVPAYLLTSITQASSSDSSSPWGCNRFVSATYSGVMSGFDFKKSTISFVCCSSSKIRVCFVIRAL
jgi:hypothetical protein